MPSAVAIRHPVKPSLRFAMALLAMYLMAAATVYLTAIPWLAKLALLVLVASSLAYYLARDVLLLLPGSWRDISLDQTDVSVTVRDGAVFMGRIASETFVSPYFVVLCMKQEWKRLLVSRVIFPDAIRAGAFREMCVHLRYAWK